MHKSLDDTHSVRYYRTENCCSVTYEQREGDEYVNSESNFLVLDLVRTQKDQYSVLKETRTIVLRLNEVSYFMCPRVRSQVLPRAM